MSKDGKAAQRDAQKKRKREKAVREAKARRQAHQAVASVKSVIDKVGEMPIVECVVSKGWQERGLAHILLARRLGPGRLSAAGYYVDTFCSGLKNTALLPAMTDEEYEKNVKPHVFNDPVEFEACDPRVARGIVEGAIAFGEKFGFRPNKRWAETKRFLEGIEAAGEEVSFGVEGKPCLVLRGGESSMGAVARLERTAGSGNFSVRREGEG